MYVLKLKLFDITVDKLTEIMKLTLDWSLPNR